jgi:hypothetical protein
LTFYQSLTEHIIALWNTTPSIDEGPYRASWRDGRDEVTAVFQEAAEGLRTLELGHPRWQIRDVIRQLDIDLLSGADVRDLLNALLKLTLNADRRAFKNVVTHEGDWRAALSAARLYNCFFTALSEMDRSLFTQREQVVVRALQETRAAGIYLTVRDGRIGTVEEYSSAAQQIATRIAQGASAFRTLFYRLINQHYDAQADHYMLGRQYAVAGGLPKAPAVPFGWMYQAILGNPLAWTFSDPTPEELGVAAETATLMRDLAATFDAEPHHMLQLGFNEASAIHFDLASYVFYDNTFMLKQLTPSQTLALLDGMFGWVRTDECTVNLDDALAVLRAVYDGAAGHNVPVVFSSQDIATRSGLATRAVEDSLDFLSKPVGEVNRDFISPLFSDDEGLTADAMFTPFLMNEDSYIMPSRLCSGPPAYEAIYAKLRDAFGPRGKDRLDSVLGRAFEDFTRDILRRANLAVKAGMYNTGQETGECDAVVETPNYVVFIECKKKGLTRKTLGGSSEQIMYDLAGAIVAPHAQLAQHEAVLSRQKSLRLVDSAGSEAVVTLAERRIVKVALTLLDLGVLSDSLVNNSLLNVVRGATWQLPTNATRQQRKTAAEFDSDASKLQRYHEEMVARSEENFRTWRSNTATWSTPLLMVLCHDILGSEQFERRLTTALHLASSCGDRVQEFYFYERAMEQVPQDAGNGCAPT